MVIRYRLSAVTLIVGIAVILLTACGDSPWRYSPAAPGAPGNLAATAGNGQVSLSWSASQNAAAYVVYYATAPGVTSSTGTKVPTVTGTSAIVTGLTNGVTYYFAVASINSSGESPLSNEVAVTPAPPEPFGLSDLQGTWYFNALANGIGACWMRGIVAVDGGGNVAVTSFLDSSGNTVAPTGLFTTLAISADGIVSQPGTTDAFNGILSAGQYRDTLVGTATRGAASQLLIILQKRVPGITYTVSDIKGTGRLVAGPLSFVYHQLASGVRTEWEHASGQVGQDQEVTYLAIAAPGSPQLPGGGNKVTSLAITADGIVAETPIPGVLPQPTALLSWGVMSADKMTVVGTATGSDGAFVLRVVQFVHPPAVPLTPSNYTLANLTGAYDFHGLANGSMPFSARGELDIDPSGMATYGAYSDSTGSTALPPPRTLSLDQQGMVQQIGAPSYNGQFSYFNDLIVTTETGLSGEYSLGICLKR
jgi:Fibronectin type III domain